MVSETTIFFDAESELLQENDHSAFLSKGMNQFILQRAQFPTWFSIYTEIDWPNKLTSKSLLAQKL